MSNTYKNESVESRIDEIIAENLVNYPNVTVSVTGEDDYIERHGRYLLINTGIRFT